MSGGGARRPCAHWLLLLLLRARALPAQEETGNVGCLFSSLVCADGEVCSDDEVIGVCVSASSPRLLASDARAPPLGWPALGLLEAEMTRVLGRGYAWPHQYTQCVFQTLLHQLHNRQRYNPQQCDQLREDQEDDDTEEEELGAADVVEDQDGNIYIPEDQLKYLEEQPVNYYPPQEVIYQHDDLPYQPQELSGHYYQPQELAELPYQPQELPYQPQELPYQPQELPYQPQELIYQPEELPYQPEELPYQREELSPEEEARAWLDLQQVLEAIQEPGELAATYEEEEPVAVLPPEELAYLRSQPSRASSRHLPPHHHHHQLGKREATSYNLPPRPLDYVDTQEDKPQYFVPDLFPNLYKTQPEDFDDAYPESRELSDLTDADIGTEDTDWQDDANSIEDIDQLNKRQDDKGATMQDIYATDNTDTQEPPVYDFDYDDSSAATPEDLVYYNPDTEPLSVESVFDRRERLDVKKPGPFFTNSPNNFFLDKLTPEEKPKTEEEGAGQTEYELPLAPQTRPKKDASGQPLLTIPEPGQQDTLTILYTRLDLETQANQLVAFIAQHLGLQPSAFTIARQPESTRLVLTVHANPEKLNASTMAQLLNADNILPEQAINTLGIHIRGFQAGTKDNVVSVATNYDRSRLLVTVLIAAVGLATILSTIGLILVIRKRSRKKETVEDNVEDKEEPVKEYKQLVRDWSRSSRASQGSVGTGARPEAEGSPLHGKRAHKISQNSDASRTSSTSSWQEEPSATTMDISTGHMVLSYMEDHLKNKQRLEQEWVGLCAYEAEPNSTSIAFKVENKKKNRYPDKLPYDHNRVLLNALVNGTNSDYINASTVMDHDPRNPAYIVSQGPMAHTVADFWQMVWEQGSVVIVMLSRLSENGYQLAQRYWPEEGSEQYHIFEVHLVSEHVWCEDYLVRSLYLKNSQTGETRTVTQFHFLSWPDGTIPTSTRAILEFRRKVNKSYRGRSCPIIIHCSDGVGRSGTYVLIDMVLNRMTKGSKEIDIAATLEHIRDQRSGMVQTRSQFEFCLMAVAEETHAILKALPQ